MAEDRVTIQEAARRLGVKEDAIRKRVRRGTMRSEKAEDGRVYVWVDTAHAEASTEEETAQDETQATGGGELVEVLRDEIVHLRAQLDRRDRELDAERDARTEERRRHDTLMQQLMQRIPELEAPTAPPEPQNEPESAEPRSSRGTPPQEPEKGTERRSWWRRIFSNT